MFGRNKIAMLAAEFLGTGVLTSVIIAVSHSQLGIAYFVGLAAGLTLLAMTFVFGGVSGAHLNPAITIGLWTARRVKTLPALAYIAAQLLGGICAYLLYTYLVNQSWSNTGEFDSRIMVAEAVGAFIFSLGWAAAVYNKLDNAKAAAVIGVSFMVGVVVAAAASAGVVNPAVALGSRMWVWGTYVLGPVLGAVIGFNLYALLFAPGEGLLNRSKASVADAKPVATAKPKAKSSKKKR
jgi:glycerol uptake facilitator-like aquaporin